MKIKEIVKRIEPNLKSLVIKNKTGLYLKNESQNAKIKFDLLCKSYIMLVVKNIYE